MLDNFQSQAISFVKLKKLGAASAEFLYSTSTGEKTQRGYYRGEIEIAKGTPLFSSVYEIDKLLNRVEKGDASGLNPTKFGDTFFNK
jgi:hypothetical protein